MLVLPAVATAFMVKLEIAAPSEMNPTNSVGPFERATYEEPSARVTVILAWTMLKLESVPKMFAPTDITPGAKVNVAATGLFVENHPFKPSQ